MKDILVRTAKTFVQAFLGLLLVGYAGVVDKDTAFALLVAAVIAGLTAVHNSLLKVTEVSKS